ncbi:hypothetical protein M2401_002253 [Pseudomonas sp. JUb42]|jgi:hypothetical protein|uniref:TniQ family protein n=1 Tax=Pseudomonas sp. JUb42 TaxID=2940611 RepID=UPI002167AFB9|nr:TniQ family protein [Pseudomonas sp. JUb42]MCS3468518.1 hypothetical protein [Pseudomonas sp. JUb42]
MHFEGWPKPLIDETFASWLFRAAHSKNCLSFNSDQGEMYYDDSEDPDFDLYSAAFDRVCDAGGLKKELIRSYFKPRASLLSHPLHRFSFCRMCIREDIVNIGMPAWRKSWCYITAPYCLRHGCLLIVMEDDPTFYKPWEAFATEVGSAPLFAYSRRWGGVPSKIPSAEIGMRIQKWLAGLDTAEWFTLSGQPELVSTSLLKNITILTMQILLSCRIVARSAGPARALYCDGREPIVHERLTYKESMNLGAVTASPYERMIALLMISCIFGLSDENEKSTMASAFRASGYRWLSDARQIGSLVPGFYSEQEYLEILDLFSAAPYLNNECLLSFIEGFEDAAYRNNVFSYAKMKAWRIQRRLRR